MSNLGNKETMAKNLKYYIEQSGKTQKELAEIVGVPTSTINNWVMGNKYPRIDKIELLANYFKILKSDLIEERTDEYREMQKNNDTLSDIVVRMRKDEYFLSIVKSLNDLDEEELRKVERVLSAFLE